jgi:large subunit ribosomal protein L13
VNTLTYKTVSANAKTVNKNWVLIDAENQVLGRVSSQIAAMLRGKHKTNFTPHVDCGDNVIVINADKIRLTGNKWSEKEYVRHTGYPGGQRFSTPEELLRKHPTRIIEKAVYGMLPKNKLGNAIKGNLYIYTGNEHPHAAQQPVKVTI